MKLHNDLMIRLLYEYLNLDNYEILPFFLFIYSPCMVIWADELFYTPWTGWSSIQIHLIIFSFNTTLFFNPYFNK